MPFLENMDMFGAFGERSKIISLKFCLLWTPSPPVSLNYHFRVNPSPPQSYHSLSLSLRCVSTHFMRFIAFLVLFLHNSWLFGVISLIVQSPRPPISLNYHSRSQPPAPLSMSDMIFERSHMYSHCCKKLRQKMHWQCCHNVVCCKKYIVVEMFQE